MEWINVAATPLILTGRGARFLYRGYVMVSVPLGTAPPALLALLKPADHFPPAIRLVLLTS